MDFVSNSQTQVKEMLTSIGVSSINNLFEQIPSHLKLPPPQQDDGLSESEGKKLIEEIAKQNTFFNFKSYLGAGAYEHHIPAIISSICSKGEFLTSYTPYQAEASQGMLQAIFEFQTAICALTKMDAANASVYDGASACAEACLMAVRFHQDRKHILVAESLHPHYRQVVKQYTEAQNITLESIPYLNSGKLDIDQLKHLIKPDTAAILIQSPNFFGILDEVQQTASLAKENGCLIIAAANPLSYGLFQPCGVLGAHIAVGDCQPFGIPLQFGGPYCGYMACKKEFVRQMPGRIVGQTIDKNGERGFVLTLQAREQHIRREKATSNICTNQALSALASLIAMLWYGKEGVQKLALANYQRASYLQEQLKKIPSIAIMEGQPIFNEFVATFKRPIQEVLKKFREKKIEPGLSLETYYPPLKNSLLIAVTETKTIEDLNHYVEIAREL